MNENIKISYPNSEKVYMRGKLYPDLKVGMRKVSLTPTVTVENGEKVIHENAPVYIYDTSGAYCPSKHSNLAQYKRLYRRTISSS